MKTLTRAEFETSLRASGMVIKNDRYDTLAAWMGGQRLAIADTTRGVYDQLADRMGVTLTEGN